jgi:hypothetical protein
LSGDHDSVEIIRRTFEVLSKGGPDALLARYEEFCTEDFEWHPALMGSVEGEQVFVGKQQFAFYWHMFADVFGEPKVTGNSFEPVGPGRVL